MFGKFCANADEIAKEAQRDNKRRERLCMAVLGYWDTKLVFLRPDATKIAGQMPARARDDAFRLWTFRNNALAAERKNLSGNRPIEAGPELR